MKITDIIALFAIVWTTSSAVAADKPAPATAPAPKAEGKTMVLSATPSNATSDEIVARVGSREITRKELDLAVQGVETQYARNGRPIPPDQIPALEHRMLDDIIGRELILREGLTHPPTNVEAKVKEQLVAVETRLGGAEGLSNALRQANITTAEYVNRTRETVIVQETMKALLDREIKVAPEEIKAYYDSNPDQMKQPESVRASHILIRLSPDSTDEIKAAKRSQIEAARTLVKNGEKFADVARKVSEDTGSASNGGDLGFISRGQMVPPQFEMAAFSLKTNELSEVVTTQIGYHLILVTERKPAQTKSFDEVKGDIDKFLRYRKSSEMADQHVKELRTKTKVEVFLKPLDTPASISAPAAPAVPPPLVATPSMAAPKN